MISNSDYNSWYEKAGKPSTIPCPQYVYRWIHEHVNSILCPSKQQCKAEISSVPLAAILTQPRRPLAAFVTRTHHWLTAHLESTRSSLPSCFPLVALSLSWCLRVFPRSTTGHFHLFNFMWFLSSHFHSLLMSPWMAAQLPGVSAAAPSFGSSADLLKVPSALLHQEGH